MVFGFGFTCTWAPPPPLFAGIPIPLLVIPHYNLVEDNAAWWVGGWAWGGHAMGLVGGWGHAMGLVGGDGGGMPWAWCVCVWGGEIGRAHV